MYNTYVYKLYTYIWAFRNCCAWTFFPGLSVLAVYSPHYGHAAAVPGRPVARRASDFQCGHHTALPPDLSYIWQDTGCRGVSWSSTGETVHGWGLCPHAPHSTNTEHLIWLRFLTGCERAQGSSLKMLLVPALLVVRKGWSCLVPISMAGIRHAL